MKTVEIWPACPITYDEKKYNYKIETIAVKVFEKETGNTIFCILSPTFIKQIKDNEFIVHYPDSLESDVFHLKHLEYQETTKNLKVIYQKEYQPKRSAGRIKEIDDLFFLESWLETTLYNAKTKKELTLEDSKIKEQLEENGEISLIGTVKIEEKDVLKMIIDQETLEFDGFYSRLQDRYIPIKKQSNNFLENYNDTVEEEIIKYLELLEIQEKDYNERNNQKAILVLKKHLTNKK